MNSYELSRNWFDWSFENPEKINPNHSALYFFTIEHCNRLGWKEKFGLPTTMAKESIGIRSYNTYIKTLNDLVDFGFIKLIEKSKNQYSSNIIALSNFNKALDKALDKALIKHATKQRESISSIDKQETINKETIQQIDFQALLEFINSCFGRNFRVMNDSIKLKYKSLLKQGYEKRQIIASINNCKENTYHKETNYQYCTPEFFSRSVTIDKYSNVSTIENSKVYSPNIIHE
jgi:hypothetical protein